MKFPCFAGDLLQLTASEEEAKFHPLRIFQLYFKSRNQ